MEKAMSHALDYTVVTNKSFADAVRAVEQKAVENGFRVLHVHDFAAMLGEKGFAREPLTIVEICNARYASEVLKKTQEVIGVRTAPSRKRHASQGRAPEPRGPRGAREDARRRFHASTCLAGGWAGCVATARRRHPRPERGVPFPR